MIRYLNWPNGFFIEKTGGHLLPWYDILRRLLCVGPFILFLLLTTLVVAIGWGTRDACMFWEQNE